MRTPKIITSRKIIVRAEDIPEYGQGPGVDPIIPELLKGIREFVDAHREESKQNYLDA